MDNDNRNHKTNHHDDDDENKNNNDQRRITKPPQRSIISMIPPPSDWLSRYNKLLDQYPLQTKMATSFCVSAFGSALGSYLSATRDNNNRAKHRSQSNAQSKSSTKINWVDVLSYAIHGGLINAPISHYWFEWLSLHGPSSNTASVLVDQLVVQPPLLALMFICLDILRANIRTTLYQFQRGHVISKSISNALRVVPSSWRFWPFAVYLTFKYLKKKHYTVALNLCSVAWTVYLSRGSAAADGDG
mmetsp:Transcript_40374/g.84458  ORF Transcript_40374/g.84458 Transcript_40374/m.84458 type:complete len:245 (-) Transcript_40374:141-875(-)